MGVAPAWSGAQPLVGVRGISPEAESFVAFAPPKE